MPPPIFPSKLTQRVLSNDPKSTLQCQALLTFLLYSTKVRLRGMYAADLRTSPRNLHFHNPIHCGNTHHRLWSQGSWRRLSFHCPGANTVRIGNRHRSRKPGRHCTCFGSWGSSRTCGFPTPPRNRHSDNPTRHCSIRRPRSCPPCFRIHFPVQRRYRCNDPTYIQSQVSIEGRCHNCQCNL